MILARICLIAALAAFGGAWVATATLRPQINAANNQAMAAQLELAKLQGQIAGTTNYEREVLVEKEVTPVPIMIERTIEVTVERDERPRKHDKRPVAVFVQKRPNGFTRVSTSLPNSPVINLPPPTLEIVPAPTIINFEPPHRR